MDLQMIIEHKICGERILNVENPDIIPSLRKVLGQINGVTISKTRKIVDTEKKSILKSIKTGYKQVKEAEATGQNLPLLDDLIAELQSSEKRSSVSLKNIVQFRKI